jgi:hypothetical protein
MPSGKVTSGMVSLDGIIKVAGSQVTIGTPVTVVLLPSLGPDGKVLWDCRYGDATAPKYVPAECRAASSSS